jgi:hypothetical protein
MPKADADVIFSRPHGLHPFAAHILGATAAAIHLFNLCLQLTFSMHHRRFRG